jgi:hypothetical protein
MSKYNDIRKAMKAYPDSPHKRIILTTLGDLEEQLNGLHFGLSNTLGYTYDTENYTKTVKTGK